MFEPECNMKWTQSSGGSAEYLKYTTISSLGMADVDKSLYSLMTGI